MSIKTTSSRRIRLMFSHYYMLHVESQSDLDMEFVRCLVARVLGLRLTSQHLFFTLPVLILFFRQTVLLLKCVHILIVRICIFVTGKKQQTCSHTSHNLDLTKLLIIEIILISSEGSYFVLLARLQIQCFHLPSRGPFKAAVTWHRSFSCLLTSARPSRVFTLAKSSLRSWWICSLQTNTKNKSSRSYATTQLLLLVIRNLLYPDHCNKQFVFETNSAS